MILSMIHTVTISHQQQTLVCDPNTTTPLNESSMVVHDLVLHLASGLAVPAAALCICN